MIYLKCVSATVVFFCLCFPRSDHKLDAVDVLLLAGLDPNARDGKDGKTALSYAVENVLGKLRASSLF